MKRLLVVLSFCFSVMILHAQYYQHLNVPVQVGSHLLKYPWVGGMNNPQFSECDLNHDGIQDLFVFDRTGKKVYTFINNGTANTIDYVYAPHYEKNFPHMRNWALLEDFNCDGIADIFTDTTLGIRVFKGYYDGNNELQFQVVQY